ISRPRRSTSAADAAADHRRHTPEQGSPRPPPPLRRARRRPLSRRPARRVGRQLLPPLRALPPPSPPFHLLLQHHHPLPRARPPPPPRRRSLPLHASLCPLSNPNNYTYPPLLAACARLLPASSPTAAAAPGTAVHASLFRRGLDSRDRFIGASLLSFYAAAGDLPAARQVFDASPPGQRDLPLWNSLLHAHLSQGFYTHVLRLSRQMPAADEVTLLALVSACAHLGALDTGRWAHASYARTRRSTTRNLGTALLNMYMRCGDVESAWSVFRETLDKDVRTWSVMIAGLAINGLPRDALALFAEMKNTGVDPDSITMTAVLSACAHAGMVDEGKKFLDCMPVEYRVQPTIEHYGCVVDLLGRAGQLEEALALIKTVSRSRPMLCYGVLSWSPVGFTRMSTWGRWLPWRYSSWILIMPEHVCSYLMSMLMLGNGTLCKG
uniref:Pentacotripeptide-repeat region of PRORP domain-containing protein n=2 Tax=Aegilops tauschii subsp. strangulata TaxID=200361 RepID=A0A453J7D9_AEGTS